MGSCSSFVAMGQYTSSKHAVLGLSRNAGQWALVSILRRSLSSILSFLVCCFLACSLGSFSSYLSTYVLRSSILLPTKPVHENRLYPTTDHEKRTTLTPSTRPPRPPLHPCKLHLSLLGRYAHGIRCLAAKPGLKNMTEAIILKGASCRWRRLRTWSCSCVEQRRPT